MKFERGDIVSVKASFWRRLIPIRAYHGRWYRIPRKAVIHGYREDLVAWETWADGQQWFFEEERLEKYERS